MSGETETYWKQSMHDLKCLAYGEITVEKSREKLLCRDNLHPYIIYILA